MISNKKKCAVVGIGHRAESWITSLVKNYPATNELVGLCDVVAKRCHDVNTIHGTRAAVYKDYDKMLVELKPDLVIVVSPDYLHAEHIVKALDAGCNVVTDKPLCTTGEDAQRILEAEQRNGRKIFMAFNYRHVPLNMKVKELLISGVIGQPVSMDLTWYLDYKSHGISYFRRWHRIMRYSGGILNTKGCHHLDLANWLMGDIPETIFAKFKQNFFGPGNNKFSGTRCSQCVHAKECEFYTDINVKEPDYEKLSLELGYKVRGVRDYIRDYCPFGGEVDIHDTMYVMVQYRNGGILNYSLNAGAPFEGWNIAINGTKGRIETKIVDMKPHRGWQKRFKIISKEGKVLDPEHYFISDWPEKYGIFVMPHDKNAYEVEVPNIFLGHGGGDFRIEEAVFGSGVSEDDPLDIFASAIHGAYSTGIACAAHRSAETGLPVTLGSILGKWGKS